jgi:hypothetical protein
MSAVFLAGCGGGGSSAAQPSPSPPSAAPAPPPAPSPPSASSGLPRFALRGTASGLQPFAFAHPFRQGDVPAGSVARGDSADWQCSPLTYWPDGSLKHAIIAGRVAVTAGTDVAIKLSAGPDPGGVALIEADLAAALPATTIAVDSDVTSLNALVGTNALHTTICAGPVMSSWVYRRPVAGSSHLVVYVEVRLFKGGAVEIFPWVENGYLLVPGPTNFVRTCSVSIGGMQKFGEVIDIKHHTRVPLVSGMTFSYWAGTDPGITPKHDRAYLLATKLIPNLGWFDPSAEALDALPQSYSPNTLAGDTSASGTAGGSGCMISNPSALYVTSAGDARAYRAMLTHGLSSGSWNHHFRDESTHLPISFAARPNVSLNSSSSPAIPAASGGKNFPGYEYPAITHLPGYAYFPFLMTGRWWFLEEMHFWSTFVYMWNSPARRSNAVGGVGSDGVIDTAAGYTVRGGAWALNCAAQAAAITPVGHPLQAQFVNAWQNSMANLYGKYVSGSIAGGAWVHPQGVLGTYSGAIGQETVYHPSNPSNAWWEAAWMHNYIACVLGYSSDLGIPQSAASLGHHVQARNHSYKLVIGRADDGLEGRYNWRRFIVYAYPIGEDSVGLPVNSIYSTHARSYSELVSGYGLASLPSTPGLSLKQHSSDFDLSAGDSSRAYGATAVAALAMAVEHGQAGALEGWNRVKGASNFATSFGPFLTNDAGNFGVLPRSL